MRPEQRDVEHVVEVDDALLDCELVAFLEDTSGVLYGVAAEVNVVVVSQFFPDILLVGDQAFRSAMVGLDAEGLAEGDELPQIGLILERYLVLVGKALGEFEELPGVHLGERARVPNGLVANAVHRLGLELAGHLLGQLVHGGFAEAGCHTSRPGFAGPATQAEGLAGPGTGAESDTAATGLRRVEEGFLLRGQCFLSHHSFLRLVPCRLGCLQVNVLTFGMVQNVLTFTCVFQRSGSRLERFVKRFRCSSSSSSGSKSTPRYSATLFT